MVDVDKKDYVSSARVAQEQATNNTRSRQNIKLHLSQRAKDHFGYMLKAASFMDQPLPRCLDQSYHDELDSEKLDFLNNDQVMVRYIRYMKARYSRILRELGYPTGHDLSETEQRTDSHAQYEETEPAPQPDQHQQPTNTEAGSPENDRAPVQDDTAIHIPRGQGPQPVEQTSFEAPRVQHSPRRTYTGASTMSQSQRRFSIQRSDTETSMPSEEAMKAFEALRNESSSQQKLAQLGNTVRLPGAGAALTPLKSPGQTEHRAGPATPMPVTPGTPGTLVKELGVTGGKENVNIGAPGPAIVPEHITLEESDDFLTVPYFWLFKIDTGKIHLS